jgi:hypothetical protein
MAKAIQSPEELFLLVRVYLGADHVREARELIMDSKDLGPQSPLCGLDPDLHCSLRLDVLEASKDWPALVDDLRKAVSGSATEDLQIGRILRILFNAAREEGISECVSDSYKSSSY